MEKRKKNKNKDCIVIYWTVGGDVVAFFFPMKCESSRLCVCVCVGKFNWKGTIKAVLRQAPEEGIALKKLRKKVTHCASCIDAHNILHWLKIHSHAPVHPV